MTPSGKILGLSANAAPISTPAGFITPNGQPISIRFSLAGGGTRRIWVNDVLIVRDGLQDPSQIVFPLPVRLMLFNGIDGLARVKCSVLRWVLVPEGTDKVAWLIDEGGGSLLHDYEMLPGAGDNEWTNRTPEPPTTDYPGMSYDLELQWYDPAALGFPLLWGNVPIKSPATCYSWQKRTAYINRDPAAVTYIPLAEPIP